MDGVTLNPNLGFDSTKAIEPCPYTPLRADKVVPLEPCLLTTSQPNGFTKHLQNISLAQGTECCCGTGRIIVGESEVSIPIPLLGGFEVKSVSVRQSIKRRARADEEA